MKVILLPKNVWGCTGIDCYNNIPECYPHRAFFIECEMSIIPRKGEFMMLSDYEDMIFKQLYCQLSNSDSDLHLLLEEIRKEDVRTPSYLRNVKELEDKSLLHMVVYGDEHEEIFNEGLTDYRWLVEEVTYKIGYSGETVFVTISHTY
nr:hypothetical protein [Prevotella sp.]